MTNRRSRVFVAILAVAFLAGMRAASAQQTAPADTTSATGLRAMALQTAQPGYTLPDTVMESQIGIRFTPVYLNQINGDVSSVAMKNSFQTNTTTPWGSTFNFLVSAQEKHYRLQDKRDDNKQLSASVLHVFNVFSNGTISFLDSRVFNRSIIPGGGFQDYIFNDQSVNAGASYKRNFMLTSNLLKSFRLDGLANGAAVKGERTYKNDQTLAAGGFGGVSTDLRKRHVRVDARAGRRETWDRSETALTEFNDLGSWEDSLSTGMMAELGDSIFVDARYVYYESERTWADQLQGSTGGQQGGAQNVFQETESRSSRGVLFAMRAKVWDRFRVTVTGNHDSQLNDYLVQETRFSNTVADGLNGNLTYVAPWKTAAIITLENVETLRDLGPLSVSSYVDTRKRASIALSHRFSKTIKSDVLASTLLTRAEYLDPDENPRDRDQVDNSVTLRIASTPYTDLDVNITLGYTGTEIINIDASQSENNRTRELYELRPAFIYFVNPHLSISQSYGVSIEYTDFVYTQASNFLDRNLIFTNKFDVRPTSRVSFLFDYSYNFHDNGSYLPDEVTGNEVLTVQGEDRRDRVNLRLEYRIMQRSFKEQPSGSEFKQSLTFFAEQLYSRFEDRDLVSETKRVTTDGQIKVGARGDYEFGTGRFLTFSLARVKRFARFGSDAEKDYWDMRSEFNYSF